MTRALALLVLLLLAAPAARAELRLDLAGRALSPLAEIVLRGENRAATPGLVVVRVDDAPSPAYADRVNAERLVPPGPFALRLRLALLATPRGRALDVGALRQVLAFAPAGSEVALTSLILDTPPALPPGARGWSFAPPGAAPLAGFASVAPDDPRLSGPGPRAVRRPGEDAVLARGIAGITRFAAELPPGRWRVTLWTEDPGEWETLPVLLEHRVRVNGEDLLLLRRSPADWVRARYLAGRDAEPGRGDLPWQSIGARRGGQVEGVVTVGAEGLVVELAGHPAAATHLAAVVAEPAAAPPAAAAAVEALREARFAESWPVLAAPPAAGSPTLRLEAAATRAVAAPGGLLVLRFRATGPGPAAAAASLAWGGDALPARLLWGHWRWRRPAPETPGLVLSPAHLRADLDALTLPDGLPRELVAVVPVPPGAPPGPRTLNLAIDSAGQRAEATVTVEVLPLHRPPPRARVGVWLDLAPHLAGMAETAGAAQRQAACDLAELAGLGLTAVAPPLATPADAPGLARFVEDLAAAAAHFPPPLLAYAPLRRLAEALGPEGAARAVIRAEAAARDAGLAPPVWTVADEPVAAGTDAASRALALALRVAGSEARLAGHLNDPADARLLPLLAQATVNPRFGADAVDIARLRAAAVAPWLYNMPRLRLAGGFYLWRSSADGLLQWHARMPTADPFDPTDGREGDVQFLWPRDGVCAPPDLDAELLDLAEAAEDLRWLAWLEATATGDAEAARLLARLRREVPVRWAATAALPAEAPPRWRAAIEELARRGGR